jgi:hypothetical protein
MIVAFSKRFLTAAMLLVLSGLSTSIPAQGINVEPRSVTLEKRQTKDGVDNYIYAAFSFRFGSNGEEGLKLTRNNWDVLFGNSSITDAFSVTMIVDDRSRIIDLGKGDWSNVPVIPFLPCYDTPTREKDVPAIVGNMYLVHSCDTNNDHEAIFRVEELNSKKNVTISWKLIAK